MKCVFEKHSVFMDGRETEILSGAIHYFRTLPEQWKDRLQKLKDCGFNTVETYIAWHLHEETEGDFHFSGRLDFVRFIRTAAELGLYVIVRPGPYICSECDLGGMPGWLLGKAGLRLRCSNPLFMQYAERYLKKVLALLKPLQCTCGGPLIAMQIENEYGSYGSDKEYLTALRRIICDSGIDIQLFTSDGSAEYTLTNGTLPDVPATVNFRNKPAQNFAALARTDTGYENPNFAMELWVGKAWHWGIPPQHHPETPVAEDIREILENKWHVNCYMFHGGTNFGFTSGANYSEKYQPLLTSYEVDAVLEESGRITPKYEAIRKVMNEFGRGSTKMQKNLPAAVPASFSLTEAVSLHDSLDILAVPMERPLPETMEFFGQIFGFIHYSRKMMKTDSGTWKLCGMKDRAVVLLNGVFQTSVMRGETDPAITLEIPEDGMLLEILVENMGRVNYGPQMEHERKGITAVCNSNRLLMNWTIRCLPMKDLSRLNFTAVKPAAGPAFFRGFFEAGQSTDLFLRFPQGTRGCVWINGFNAGRYWNIGPQETLYLPAPVVKPGRNEVVVFETDGLISPELSFAPARIIGPLTDMSL